MSRAPRLLAAAALAAAILAGCDDLLVRPAPAPARLALGVEPGALRAASTGVTNAFDAADSLRVLLIPAPDSLHGRPFPGVAELPGDPEELAVLDVTLPFTPADSTSVSLDVPAALLVRDSATALVLYALMDGGSPLFFGVQVVRIRRGETTAAVADTLYASAGRVHLDPPGTLTEGDCVKLAARVFFATGDTIPLEDAILATYALDPTIVEAKIDSATNNPEVVALAPGTTKVVVEAFAVGEVVADTVDVTVRAAPSEFTAHTVYAGADHTCALRSGQPWCWGTGFDGQLGHGGNFGSTLPFTVDFNGQSYRTMSLGYRTTCAISMTDRLFCWGRNVNGEMGIGTAGPGVLSPVEVPAPPPPVAVGSSTGAALATGWRSVGAGMEATCAVRAADSLAFCWGKDNAGRLGLGGAAQTAPVTPIFGYQWDEVEIGTWYACGVEATLHVVKCWGSNAMGVLGDSLTHATHSPVPINAATTFTDVAVGPRHACALSTGGEVWCWGNNDVGQMGTPDAAAMHLNPTVVPLPAGAVAVEVAVGDRHSCARLAGGDVYCWGGHDEGQSGVGDPAALRVAPTRVDFPAAVASVTAGWVHGCAVSNLVVYCWGSDDVSQLGNMDGGSSLVPTPALVSFTLPPPPVGRRAATVFRIPLRPQRTQPGAGR